MRVTFQTHTPGWCWTAVFIYYKIWNTFPFFWNLREAASEDTLGALILVETLKRKRSPKVSETKSFSSRKENEHKQQREGGIQGRMGSDSATLHRWAGSRCPIAFSSAPLSRMGAKLWVWTGWSETGAFNSSEISPTKECFTSDSWGNARHDTPQSAGTLQPTAPAKWPLVEESSVVHSLFPRSNLKGSYFILTHSIVLLLPHQD